MPQLDPTWFASQIFWLIVSIILLYFMLKIFVLPRLNAVLQLRDTTRQADLAAAETFQQQAEHARKAYERTLQDTHARSRQVFDDAEVSIKKLSDAAEKKLDEKIKAHSQQADAALAKKVEALRVHLTESGAAVALEITRKLTGKAPSEAQANKALQAVHKGS